MSVYTSKPSSCHHKDHNSLIVIIISMPQLALLTNVCVFHNCRSTHTREYAPIPSRPALSAQRACPLQPVFYYSWQSSTNTSGQRIRGDGGMVPRGGEVSEEPMERGCEQAEDADLRPSIITVPHEECQLLQTRANPTFADLWLLGPKPTIQAIRSEEGGDRLVLFVGILISSRASAR